MLKAVKNCSPARQAYPAVRSQGCDLGIGACSRYGIKTCLSRQQFLQK